MEIKPYQIAELSTQYGGSTTLSELSAVVLTAAGRTYDCPQCGGAGQIANPDSDTPPVIECPTCQGWGKTVIPYIEQCDSVKYVPDPSPPEAP